MASSDDFSLRLLHSSCAKMVDIMKQIDSQRFVVGLGKDTAELRLSLTASPNLPRFSLHPADSVNLNIIGAVRRSAQTEEPPPSTSYLGRNFTYLAGPPSFITFSLIGDTTYRLI
ncbi:MAG: hypothetical protein EOO38_24465 [Cytophagaceae bacterium]|nr:MAG: hypothetical protein EOO38_24465 [Cytophagaceae bacterium]